MWSTTKSLDNQGSCARVVFLFKDQCTSYLLSHEVYFSTQSLFDFEKTKESQPKSQNRIYYMIFSLIILDKERLKEVFCVTKEVGFDSSSVKNCRITNKFDAKKWH